MQIARPMPWPPPVTNATFPGNWNLMFRDGGCCCEEQVDDEVPVEGSASIATFEASDGDVVEEGSTFNGHFLVLPSSLLLLPALLLAQNAGN